MGGAAPWIRAKIAEVHGNKCCFWLILKFCSDEMLNFWLNMFLNVPWLIHATKRYVLIIRQVPIQLKGRSCVALYFGRNCWLGTMKLLCGHSIHKGGLEAPFDVPLPYLPPKPPDSSRPCSLLDMMRGLMESAVMSENYANGETKQHGGHTWNSTEAIHDASILYSDSQEQ